METPLVEVEERELRLTRHDSSWRSSQFTRELSLKELQILVLKGDYISEVPTMQGDTVKLG